MGRKYLIAVILIIFTLMMPVACGGVTVKPTPQVTYSLSELEYRLFSHFDNVFWCDPDLYPVARPGQEETNSLQQFPVIRANEAEFSAILEYLGIPDKAEYSNEEKLLIYREHKELTLAVQITASGDSYNFVLRVEEGQGERIEGIITESGNIEVLKREPSFNTCPICLAKGTIIDTPEGPIPIEELSNGMAVWTLGESGKQVAAVVMETSVTPVPSFFQVVSIRLDDGRSVTASAGHFTAEGRALGDYQPGDILDGGLVIAVEVADYAGNATYDLLPSGTTGFYWANGVLLESTLMHNRK